jgi:hypothetical protein
MGIKDFMTLQIIGIVAVWASRVLSDGRVTIKEAVELARRLAEVLDVPVDIERSTLTEMKTEGEEGEPLSGGETEVPKRVVKPEE